MTDQEKQAKALAKEKRAKEKLDKRLAKIAAKKNKAGKVTVEKTTSADWNEPASTTPSQPEKKSWFAKQKEKREFKKNLYDKKDFKDKKQKEKHNYKLAFKEFPVKMVKEVSKIKWTDKKNLVTKFIEVLIFMVCSAAFFFLIDWIFKLIFTAIKVIQ